MKYSLKNNIHVIYNYNFTCTPVGFTAQFGELEELDSLDLRLDLRTDLRPGFFLHPPDFFTPYLHFDVSL